MSISRQVDPPLRFCALFKSDAVAAGTGERPSYRDVVSFGKVAAQSACRGASLDAADDMLETFSNLAVLEPDLMGLVLQVSVAAMVNVQSVETVEGEMKRRAVVGN